MADSLDIILARHQAYLQRVATHTGNVSIEIIDSLNKEFKVDLIDWLDKNNEYRLTLEQTKQVEVLSNKIKATRGKAIDQATERLEVDMFDLAQREQLWLSTGLETLGTPTLATSSVSALSKMVTRTAFDGATIKQYYNKLSEDDTARIISTVQRGLSDGLTLPQITNSVFGTKRLNYTDGVLQTTRNSVMNTTTGTNAGVVRTVVNGVNNESKMMLYNANSDIINKVDYTITFDGRTSDVCVANSTKGINGTSVYKLGTEPSLPQHPNCRTYYSPVIDGIDIETTRPAVTDTRTRREREKAFLAESRETGEKIGTIRKRWEKENIKQVSSKLTFSELLESDKQFAVDWFGPTKYKLWSEGNIPVNGFVDVKGKTLTIDELYKKNPDAFKRAGIKPK